MASPMPRECAPGGSSCKNGPPERDGHLLRQGGLVAVGLEALNRLFQGAVFSAPQPADLVERGETLLCLWQVAEHQIELAGIFQCPAVLGVDAQSLVVILLCGGVVRQRALAERVTHHIVPVGVAGVVDWFQLSDGGSPFLLANQRAYLGEPVVNLAR